MEETRKLLVEKVVAVGDVNGSVGDFLLEKLKQLLHLLENVWGFLVEKLNEIFPPETRSETLQRWARVGLPVALVLLCLYCCCCRRSCCCKRGRGALKMMKAPGRDGALMPRAAFEHNPRDYFLDLRAGKELLY